MNRLNTNPMISLYPAEASFNLISKKILEILRFADTNTFCGFYGEKFRKSNIDIQNIKSYADFEKLPFTTKNEIISKNPDEILFVPFKDVDFVKFSSGTSGKGLSVVYRSFERPEVFTEVNKFLMKDISRIFILNSARGIPWEFEWFRSLGKLVVIGEMQNLEASAILAQKTKIDAISASPSRLQLFIPYLQKYYNLSEIKALRLHAETTTLLQWKLIKNYFPNAILIKTYSMTEAGNVAYQCRYLAGQENLFNVFHPAKSFFMELIEGEIVLTSLYTTPLILIRYQTGDLGEFVSLNCECGEKIAFKMLGRVGDDRIKVDGAEFRRNQVEGALASISHFVETGIFHIYEEEKSGKIEPYFILEIRPRFRLNLSEEERILNIFSEKLFISQKSTLADLIRSGSFVKPVLKILEEKNISAKNKILIDHRNQIQ